MPNGGIYLVTLKNAEPISVNADRPKIAKNCVFVTKENCKLGKCKTFSARRRDYERTFGAKNVHFAPILALTEPASAERLIKQRLIAFRIRGKSGRLTEWLEGITPDEVKNIVFEVTTQLGNISSKTY